MIFEILLECDDWVVINKPVGAEMHSQSDSAGLVVLLERQLKQSLWPIHRLDKVTSGCLLLAKNASAARQLSEQFAQRTINKIYMAIARGKPKKKKGWIKGDMIKSRNGCWKLTRTTTNAAVTYFESQAMTKEYQSDDVTRTMSGFRLYTLQPKTGKTHQLRVAMKSIGVPILGDLRYGGEPANRVYLHASELTFNWHDQPITVLAPNPFTGYLIANTR